MRSVINLRAEDRERALWLEAAQPKSFSSWARNALNEAARAELAARARREDEQRQRQLLREAMGR